MNTENGNKPAYPTITTKNGGSGNHSWGNTSSEGGLTKREYFAGLALQSLIVHEHSPERNGTEVVSITDLCADVVRYADEILNQLSIKKTPQA